MISCKQVCPHCPPPPHPMSREPSFAWAQPLQQLQSNEIALMMHHVTAICADTMRLFNRMSLSFLGHDQSAAVQA